MTLSFARAFKAFVVAFMHHFSKPTSNTSRSEMEDSKDNSESSGMDGMDDGKDIDVFHRLLLRRSIPAPYCVSLSLLLSNVFFIHPKNKIHTCGKEDQHG